MRRGVADDPASRQALRGLVAKAREILLTRLGEIGQALEKSGHALALIGLGSAGLERERLDEFSDLDFFAIVEDGWKDRFIENLDWLESIRPVVFRFRNTADGYKLLFDDGVFCEFAVFERSELASIPFAEGRVVWKQPLVDDAVARPLLRNKADEIRTVEWLVGEALTNLYVGMCRYRRGEKLSAQRFVQHYCVDRVIELAEKPLLEQPGLRDPFSRERRLEQRYPELARLLPEFIQGYHRTPESALALLDHLENHFDVNTLMAAAVRELCDHAGD